MTVSEEIVYIVRTLYIHTIEGKEYIDYKAHSCYSTHEEALRAIDSLEDKTML